MKNHNSLSLSLDSLSAFSFMALSKLSPFSLFHSQCHNASCLYKKFSVILLHIFSDSRGTSGRTVRDPHLPSQYSLEPFTCEQTETKISVTKTFTNP